MLLNGTIQHGTQIFAPGLTRTPHHLLRRPTPASASLCATAATGRNAQHRRHRPRRRNPRRLRHPGDHIRFYEINPLVQPIAQNLFTYLRDSPAQITFADGDARTSLTREAPQNFDVLAVDAFSGDAIPLHLLTTEAIALYKKHLAPNGILAFHVSNQYLEPRPRDRPTRHRGQHAIAS